MKKIIKQFVSIEIQYKYKNDTVRVAQKDSQFSIRLITQNESPIASNLTLSYSFGGGQSDSIIQFENVSPINRIFRLPNPIIPSLSNFSPMCSRTIEEYTFQSAFAQQKDKKVSTSVSSPMCLKNIFISLKLLQIFFNNKQEVNTENQATQGLNIWDIKWIKVGPEKFLQISRPCSSVG